MPTGDPWLLLAAAAHATERLRLGTHVTAGRAARVQRILHWPSRRSIASSGGRVIFGAGLGGNERELAAFGDETDERERAAEMLDEALDVLRGLVGGER